MNPLPARALLGAVTVPALDMEQTVWRVTAWTPHPVDRDTMVPGWSATHASFLPGEALQAVVAQARAEQGAPALTGLTWTVTRWRETLPPLPLPELAMGEA